MEEKRQAFNDNLLAAIISRSPTSGRMRYAPTVYGEKQNIKRHHPSPHPQQINGKYVGAYRIRPPHRRTCQAMGTFTEKRKYARRRHSPFAHIRAYAIRPYNWWRKTNTKRHDASPYPQRTKGKYVGAYRIRPSRRRTGLTMGTFTEIRWITRRHHFPFRPH